MKKTLLLVLATALTAAPALAAIDMNAEVFVTHKATLQGVTDTAAKNEGTDVERFRIFLSNKFNDQWAFKGRFEFKADGTPNRVFLPEAHFVGTSVLMADDTVKFGIMENPVFAIESSMGNRWITKPLIDAEGFAVNSGTQSGASYKIKLGAVNLTAFSLSGESGDNLDSDDTNKLNGAMVDYKFNDAVTAWIQQASINLNVGGTAPPAGPAIGVVKSTAVMSAGVNYKTEMVDAGYNYHSTTYTVEAGNAPKNNMVMGLNGLFKKIAGSATNLYVHYWAGYDSYADTGEDTQSKMMIGPTWNLADNKINLGAFYEMETLQGDYKTANPLAKEPSTMYVKMAAKF